MRQVVNVGRGGRRFSSAVLATVASLLTLTLSAGSAAAAAGATSCTHGFKPVKVRDLDGRWKTMGATRVTVVPGSHQAWAIAAGRSTSGGIVTTDLLHFNGMRWERLSMAYLGVKYYKDYLILKDIYAHSPSDIWAVGWYHQEPNIGYQPLVMHWNGQEWTIMPTPTVPIVDEDVDGGELTQVVAVAPDNVWVTGERLYDYETRTKLVYHWNGSEWTSGAASGMAGKVIIRIPYSDTLWSAGSWADETAHGPLLQRYKSGSWREPIRLDGLDAPFSPRAGVALAWDDIWAVGEGQAVHKNASTWSVVPTPQSETGTAVLRSVAAVSSSNVWAVGHTEHTEGRITTYRPLVERWDGSSWSIAPSPLDGTQGILFDIALRKTGWGWVVGSPSEVGGYLGDRGGFLLQACGI